MSRSRLTVILYSAAGAETASAASDAPAIAVRAVMPTIPKRRRIAYSLAVSNPSPGAQLAFARCRRLGADITRPQSPRKGGAIACWPGGPPVLGDRIRWPGTHPALILAAFITFAHVASSAVILSLNSSGVLAT